MKEKSGQINSNYWWSYWRRKKKKLWKESLKWEQNKQVKNTQMPLYELN